MHFMKYDLTFRMSQHTFSKVTVMRLNIIYIQKEIASDLGNTKNSSDMLIK